MGKWQKKEKRTGYVHVRLSQSTEDKIKELQVHYDLSKTELVEKLIFEAYQEINTTKTV